MKVEKVTGWNPYGITLESANPDDDRDYSQIVIYAFRRRVELRIPSIIKPYRVRHQATTWDAATIARMGRDWWEEKFPREYGFRLSGDFLQVFLGHQTHSSEDTQSWSCFLPWTQWRHVRFSLYDTTGAHFWTQLERERRKARGDGMRMLAEQNEAEKACPKVSFVFRDYDGSVITAATHIEEREWLRGEKWCRWLSWFCQPKVRRSLDIEYSAEVGPRKGSWKGGTIGCGIDLLPGELHEEAFRRHCIKENLTFMYRLPVIE